MSKEWETSPRMKLFKRSKGYVYLGMDVFRVIVCCVFVFVLNQGLSRVLVGILSCTVLPTINTLQRENRLIIRHLRF